MNFRQLTEENCGQVNPLTQLATHMTQDQARQGAISKKCTNENLMVPNTFNMNELMLQMQSLESMSAGPSSNDSIWSWDKVQMQNLESLSAGPSSNDSNWLQDNVVYDNFFPPQEPYLIGNQVPAYFPLAPEYFPNNWESFNRFGPTTEEFNKLQKIFNDVEEDIAKSEADVESASCSLQYYSRTELTAVEAEKFQRLQKDVPEVKRSKYLHYDGVFIEDVYGVSNLGIEFNDFEYFQNFVENYVLAKSSLQYQKYQPTLKEPPPIAVTIEKKVETTVIRYNKFVFEIPGTKPRFSEDLTRILFNCLKKAEHHYHAIKVANAITFDSKSIPDDLVFPLTDLYLHEHCFYQACQTLFIWLKNNPNYSDIVPPNFAMEDQLDTAVDEELLRALQKMFIKAAQRSPIHLDIRVQIALAKLCQIDQDHEKSVDCYRAILKKPLHQHQIHTSKALMSLGNSLALANKPKEAIIPFSLLKNVVLFATKAITNIGLMHLYKRNYKVAFNYLFKVIKNHIDGCEASQGYSLENSWTRLRLCCELMRREDLCEAIDNRDYSKLNEITFEK